MAMSSAHVEFPSTHWSLVAAAGVRGSDQAELALADLCQRYWFPVYAFIRRRGQSAEDARDLTQGFFAEILDKASLNLADPDRGRFRAFLLTAAKHYVSKQRDKAAALKRGGGLRQLSIDYTEGERRYLIEPIEAWTPERIFERQWALTLLERTLEQLQQEYVAAGRSPLFEALRVFLTGEPVSPLDAVAAELKMSTGSVKVAIHRLRQKYRERLRQEIAQTVASPDEVDAELQALRESLRG